jgi:hypothetical protein
LAKYEEIQVADVERAIRRTLAPENRAVIVVHHDPNYRQRGAVVEPAAP